MSFISLFACLEFLHCFVSLVACLGVLCLGFICNVSLWACGLAVCRLRPAYLCHICVGVVCWLFADGYYGVWYYKPMIGRADSLLLETRLVIGKVLGVGLTVGLI